MQSKVTKTVKVSEEVAEDWEEYVRENPEVDSLSHLIRLSVERELQGRYQDPREVGSGVSEGGDGAAEGEALTLLREIRTGLSDLEKRLESVEQLEAAEANYDLKKASYSVLPSQDDLPTPMDKIEEIPSGEDPEKLPVKTAREVAQAIGADVQATKDALDELADSTGQVLRSDENWDGRYYWKRGE